MNIWRILNTERTSDIRTIKRAYAKRLKEVHPEDDPKGFQRLRAAYEEALQYAEADAREKQAPVSREVGTDLEPESYAERAGTDFEDEDVALGDAVQDDVRGRADEILDPVFALLANKDVSGASEMLDRLWRSSDLHDLELRRAFEEQVANRLAQTSPLSLWFLDEAMGLFGWEEDYSHLRPEYADIVEWFMSRREGHKRATELRQEGQPWWNEVLFSQRALAAHLLTGPSRPRLFRLLSFEGGLFKSMTTLMHQLAVYFPSVLTYELNPETVSWWQCEIERTPPLRIRVVRFLTKSYWIPGAVIIAFLIVFNIEPPLGLLLPFVFLCLINLFTNLAPYLLPLMRPVVHSSGHTKSMLFGLGVIMVISGAVTDVPWNFLTGGMGFFAFLLFTGEDWLAFLAGTFGLWVVLRITLQAGSLPISDPGVSLTFIWSEFTVIAMIKVWRWIRSYRPKKEKKLDWQEWQRWQNRMKWFD